MLRSTCPSFAPSDAERVARNCGFDGRAYAAHERARSELLIARDERHRIVLKIANAREDARCSTRSSMR